MPTVNPINPEHVNITSSEDVAVIRHKVRQCTIGLRFSLVEQTKMITACSELARNIIQHAGGRGSATIECLDSGGRRGIRVTFSDEGPGIADLELAMRDGYTTGGGLGMGLGGAKRLCNEFSIESKLGQGTRVVIARWK